MQFLRNYTSGQYVWTLIYKYPDGMEASVFTMSEHLIEEKKVFEYLNNLMKRRHRSIITEPYKEATIMS